MQTSKYVVVYDSSDMHSARHLLPRSGRDDPTACGLRISNRRNMRFAADPLVPADCVGCLIAHAAQVAEIAHRNQYDMDGSLHIEHVRRVVGLVAAETEEREMTIVVANLHDVLEDSSWTPRRLREEKFAPSVVESVWLLTWDRQNVSRETYISALAQAHGKEARLAQVVKRADLKDNIVRCRKQGMTEREARYWQELRYIERHAFGFAA